MPLNPTHYPGNLQRFNNLFSVQWYTVHFCNRAVRLSCLLRAFGTPSGLREVWTQQLVAFRIPPQRSDLIPYRSTPSVVRSQDSP